MDQGDDRNAPLDTSRPWLSVAGCLGGGMAAVAAVALLAALVVALLVVRSCRPAPPPATEVEFEAALGRLCESPAIRVATREIAVRVEVSKPTVATIWRPELLGGGLPIEIGRTRAVVVAPSNRVQYVVPVDRQAPIATEWSEDGLRRAVVVTLPAPRVDRELVEVASDPRMVSVEVDRDWVDHLVGDGGARDEALALVREAVVEQASTETALFEIREKARATVEGMIRALLPPAWSAHTIRIRWDDEVAADGDPLHVPLP
ncbi:MAG: hypothetical protein RIS86_676 [Planctomycetota bacterium]|jgi:hypothetical protein